MAGYVPYNTAIHIFFSNFSAVDCSAVPVPRLQTAVEWISVLGWLHPLPAHLSSLRLQLHAADNRIYRSG